MKVLVSFQSNKSNIFEGSRLRKTIKGALELNDVRHTSFLIDYYDAVHLISPDESPIIYEANARGIPVVASALMCEGEKEASYLDFKFDDGKITYTLKNKALKFLNKVDHVLVPCELGMEVLKKAGVTTPISVLMPGVNMARFDFNRKDEKKLFFSYFREDENKKLVIGNGEPENMEGFTAFIKSAEKNPDALFYFFLNGKFGSIKSRKIRQAIKKAPKNFHISESVNDDIYKSALINASVFMAPCYKLPGIVTILEAMAAKCEIIIRSQLPLPNFIIDNKTAHVAKFSETLISICSDCLQSKIKSTVTDAYEEASKYNIDVVGKQLTEIYENEINKKMEVISHD